MKHVLLSIMCVCTSLALLAFADTQLPQKQHQLPQPAILKLWTGDLDGMVERRVIRALVAPPRTSYWLIGIRQTGAEYELLKAFANEINNSSCSVQTLFLLTEVWEKGDLP